jgi:cobalt/nickel transport protein
MRLSAGLVLLACVTLPGRAGAHFHLLLPSSHAARKGEPVLLTCRWGHPFEHQLFDAHQPLSLTVRAPNGKKVDLSRSLEKIDVPAGDRPVVAFQTRYRPEARGDHVFLLDAPPVWMDEDGEYFRDTVKVVLHVQTQNGWEARVGGEAEWVPLTRPYGLQPGMVFQAQAHAGGRPLAGALVEVERYNEQPPCQLPPDEQITRTARTDPNGVVTVTLMEPGWWCLTASTAGGTREHDGKACPVRRRMSLWVFVDEAAPGR